ncbi:MAG: hypothetical protein E5W87_29105 [Mesorhizobium sp.]|nr:MAG: hypothetical protein E5W87_29105 [Mesorhizobium sp.]
MHRDERQIRGSLSITPERTDLMVLRGYAYLKLRRFGDAEQVFRAAAGTGNRDALMGLNDVKVTRENSITTHQNVAIGSSIFDTRRRQPCFAACFCSCSGRGRISAAQRIAAADIGELVDRGDRRA